MHSLSPLATLTGGVSSSMPWFDEAERCPAGGLVVGAGYPHVDLGSRGPDRSGQEQGHGGGAPRDPVVDARRSMTPPPPRLGDRGGRIDSTCKRDGLPPSC